MNCELFRRHVGVFVDGELDPASAVEFERHLEACDPCLDHLEFEGVTRELVRESIPMPPAPAHLADRVRAALDEEDRSTPEAREPFIPIRWRVAVPLSAAAAMGIFILAAVEARGEQQEALAVDVVRVHSAGLPSDVTLATDRPPETEAAEAEVSRYFRGKLGFPVRPAEFNARDVRLVGARLSNVRERQAAALYYDVGGQRVTVVVTDAPVEATGESVEVEGRQIYFRDVHGYAVPVRQQAGLRYAFTGDVDRERLMQLAASARMP